MAIRVLQGAQEDVTVRRSLEKKWIAQLKEDDRFQVINRDEGADILSLLAKTLFDGATHHHTVLSASWTCKQSQDGPQPGQKFLVIEKDSALLLAWCTGNTTTWADFYE